METKVMRDCLINTLYALMKDRRDIFFLSADFGSPALDRFREDFGDRFINVGIAEQNLINIATGMALEGFTVYAYAIAPFLTMRAYEQIRNLSILSQVKDVNINMIGVGAGLSYDVTGPTHHCLEDSCIMHVLPNFTVFSPSDHVSVEKFVEFSLRTRKPKYIRLDGKAQPRLYQDPDAISFERGFSELRKGDRVCMVSTGYMTQKAVRIAERLAAQGVKVGVIDVYLLKPLDEGMLHKALSTYRHVITLEEAFILKGSLDGIVSEILRKHDSPVKLTPLGFGDKYVFAVGDREHLHRLNALDEESILATITGLQ